MNKSFWTELWYFLLMLMGGFAVVASLTIVISVVAQGMINTPLYYHVIQWLQTIFVMMVPALVWCRVRMKQSCADYLGMRNTASWKQYCLVLVISLISLPLLDVLTEACKNIPLPEMLRQMAEEDAAAQELILNKMLSVGGFGGWFELILLMSIATAIGEELTFRGALLTLFRKYSKCNKHVVAVIIGFFFSLMHMEIYGFIPRWLLGTIFVYLVYYIGCIWPSVLAHAINNLYALLQYKGIID